MDREQLQYRVLGIRHINPDGRIQFRPSGEDAFSAAVSLRTAGDTVGADNAGLALVPPHGERDVAAQGCDHLDGRELLAGVCEVVFAVSAVVAATAAVVAVVVSNTKDAEPPKIISVPVIISSTGTGEATFPINPEYVNETETGFCDLCAVGFEAGDCLKNCTGYDKDATNAKVLYIFRAQEGSGLFIRRLRITRGCHHTVVLIAHDETGTSRMRGVGV